MDPDKHLVPPISVPSLGHNARTALQCGPFSIPDPSSTNICLYDEVANASCRLAERDVRQELVEVV